METSSKYEVSVETKYEEPIETSPKYDMPKTEETTTKYEKPIESTTKYEVPTQNTSEKVYEYSTPEPYYKVVMDRVRPAIRF